MSPFHAQEAEDREDGEEASQATFAGNASPPVRARRNALVLIATSMAAAAICHANDRASDSVNHSANHDTVAKLLRTGGCVMLLRHAATEPGVGDPPGFTLSDCATQRNLSVAGQQEARRIGAWFERHKLAPRAVRSSAWCRCKDTADGAFGKHEVWPALNSTFGDRVPQPDATGLLRQALARVSARQFEVWVTHQVNISAFAGQFVGMGEALILAREGRLLARTTFA